jgi:hypothetical protein
MITAYGRYKNMWYMQVTAYLGTWCLLLRTYCHPLYGLHSVCHGLLLQHCAIYVQEYRRGKGPTDLPKRNRQRKMGAQIELGVWRWG